MSTTRTHRAGSHKAPRQPLTGRRRAAFIAGGTAVAVLAGGGAAFAYWTTTGTGSGSAAARTMVAPTISTATASADLYPGGTGTLSFTASNPNPFPVSVTLSNTITYGAKGTCSTPALTFGGSTFTLVAGATNVAKTAPISMGATASDDCQGQPITVNLTTNSTSN